MSARTVIRFIVTASLAVGPLVAIGCGSAGDLTSLDYLVDAATDEGVDADGDASASVDAEDATADTGLDSSRFNPPDAGPPPKTLNACGGYSPLVLDGLAATPGHSCGACGDGTIACIGSNTVACAGGSTPPCPPSTYDAGPNPCGGYAPLTFLGASASPGDLCRDCGYLVCATANALVCNENSTYYGGCTTDAGIASACTVPDAAYTASPAVPTLPPETRPTTTSVSAIGFASNALVYNPFDGLVYVAVSSAVSAQGNSIAVVEPTTATILETIYVGPNPTHLALSDDGKVLWVYLSGSPSMRRLDLSTYALGPIVALGSSFVVDSIATLAGTHDSLAIAGYAYSYPTASYGYMSALVLYDNGVPRPYGVGVLGITQNFVVASGSPALLFASTEGPYSMGAICADSDGAFAQTSTALATNSNQTSAVFSQGTVYTSDGHAYDAKTGTLLSTFVLSSSGYLYPGPVAVDAKNVYFLSSVYDAGNYWSVVTAFDRTTYQQTGTDVLAGSTPNQDGGTFARWGRYGFAFLTGNGIEIARSTLIPDSP